MYSHKERSISARATNEAVITLLVSSSGRYCHPQTGLLAVLNISILLELKGCNLGEPSLWLWNALAILGCRKITGMVADSMQTATLK
jgi:hypothetical protein